VILSSQKAQDQKGQKEKYQTRGYYLVGWNSMLLPSNDQELGANPSSCMLWMHAAQAPLQALVWGDGEHRPPWSPTLIMYWRLLSTPRDLSTS
jgi:hypothetical protein